MMNIPIYILLMVLIIQNYSYGLKDSHQIAFHSESTVELKEKTGCGMKDEFLKKFIPYRFPELTDTQIDYIMKII